MVMTPLSEGQHAGADRRALDALDQMLAEAVAPPPPPPTKPVWMRAGA